MEVAALFTLHSLSGGAQTGHFSPEAVASKFRSDLRGDVKEALGELVRDPRGYVLVKPTSGGLTYGITKRGVERLRILKMI
jgi:hypothetical protein